MKPILEKANDLRKNYKTIINYVEMKHNLLLSYSTYLSFYLLLKIEGKSVKDHPVLFKLTHIKTLLDNLGALDSKIQSKLQKLMRTQSNKKKSQ